MDRSFASQTPNSASGMPFSSASFGTARTALPRVRATLFVNYKVGDLTFQLRERWRSKLDQANVAGSVYVDGWIPSAHYTDVTFSYAIPKTVWGFESEASLNIQNLLDSKPKNVGLNTATGIGNSAGFVGGDDPIGRYFTVGIKLRR